MEVRVRITRKSHPHFGEIGTIKLNDRGNVELVQIFGKEMFEIDLDNASTLIKGCFVQRSDVTLLD